MFPVKLVSAVGEWSWCVTTHVPLPAACLRLNVTLCVAGAQPPLSSSSSLAPWYPFLSASVRCRRGAT